MKSIRDIVDRFRAAVVLEPYAFSLRLVTVGSPNWRSKALPMLQRVTVQSPGVDAWLVSKENAAVLVAELSKRTDFHRTQRSGILVIHTGQSQTLSQALRPKKLYAVTFSFREKQRLTRRSSSRPEQLQEGYSLQISPLLVVGRAHGGRRD